MMSLTETSGIPEPRAPLTTPGAVGAHEALAHDTAEEWWSLYRGYVRGRLSAMTRDPNLVDDLMVETFARLLRHLRAGRPVPTSPKAWLSVISKNLLIDHLRLSAVRSEEARADLPHQEYQADFEEVERRQEAHEALSILTPRERQVMELRDFSDLSTRDTALIMGITDQAVRSIRHKAVARLRAARPNGPTRIEEAG